MGDLILLTGVDGYVGSRLAAPLSGRGDVLGVSRRPGASTPCDVSDPTAVAALARQVTPTAIVHAAGTKDIRACAQQPSLAFDANVRTTLNLLDAFPGVPLIYVSTDYVFAGDRGQYTEDDVTGPRTTYGHSKLTAEQVGRLRAPDEFCAVRVSALYDGDATFLRFLRDQLTAGTAVDCYEDAYYSPTALPDFVAAIGQLLDAGATRPGVVHVAGPRISRYGFACAYAAAFGHDPALVVPTRLGPGPVPLFPDLSLDTTLARSALDFRPSSHEEALDALAERRLA
ncbi:MAG TPA: SDR family oxidoreductase [Luteitalea sp.]|nr:SDR family oxidoreductase [Luteitalea sp.]